MKISDKFTKYLSTKFPEHLSMITRDMEFSDFLDIIMIEMKFSNLEILAELIPFFEIKFNQEKIKKFSKKDIDLTKRPNKLIGEYKKGKKK